MDLLPLVGMPVQAAQSLLAAHDLAYAVAREGGARAPRTPGTVLLVVDRGVVSKVHHGKRTYATGSLRPYDAVDPCQIFANAQPPANMPPEALQAFKTQQQQLLQQCRTQGQKLLERMPNTNVAGMTPAQYASLLSSFKGIYDYVSSPPNTNTTHDERVAADRAMLHNAGTIGTVAVSAALTPAAGAAFAILWSTVIENAAVWLGNILGFNDPIPDSQQAFFDSPCVPGSHNFSKYWPQGVPTGGPSDPRWLVDPQLAFLATGQGGTGSGAVRLQTPPYDRSKYQWSRALNPNASFETVAFGLLVANEIAARNCNQYLDPGKLLDELIIAWNDSHEMPVRRVDIDAPPPPDQYGLPNGYDVNDPISDAFRAQHFDWGTYQTTGRAAWLDRAFFEVKDGPAIPQAVQIPHLGGGGHGGGGHKPPTPPKKNGPSPAVPIVAAAGGLGLLLLLKLKG